MFSGRKPAFNGKLRQLHESLQLRIVATLERLNQLRDGADYELFRLSQARLEFLREIAERQAKAIEDEIAKLEAEARELAEEIDRLGGGCAIPNPP